MARPSRKPKSYKRNAVEAKLESFTKVVLRRVLGREEVSLMALVHGETVIPECSRSQTGVTGIRTQHWRYGAYSPVPHIRVQS